jgi:hypothetical protein
MDTSKWQVTNERFVAHFDIMGFKNSLMRLKHEDVANSFGPLIKIKHLTEVLDDLRNSNEESEQLPPDKLALIKKYQIKTVMFSDTILLISENIEEENAMAMVRLSQRLLKDCAIEGIPIKGAIAAGEFTADFEKSIYYGMPLVDAYELSEDLAFYGAAFHNTAEFRLSYDVVNARTKDFEIKLAKVPLKSANLATHLIINHFSGMTKDEIDGSLQQMYDSCSGKVRKYFDNTISTYGLTFKSEPELYGETD